MAIPRHVQKEIKNMGIAQIQAKVNEGKAILDLGKLAERAASNNPDELKAVQESRSQVKEIVEFLEEVLTKRGND